MHRLTPSQQLLAEFRDSKDPDLLMTHDVTARECQLGAIPHTRMASQFMGRNAHASILRRAYADREFILDTRPYYAMLAPINDGFIIHDSSLAGGWVSTKSGCVCLKPGRYFIQAQSGLGMPFRLFAMRFDSDAAYHWWQHGFLAPILERRQLEPSTQMITIVGMTTLVDATSYPWLWAVNYLSDVMGVLGFGKMASFLRFGPLMNTHLSPPSARPKVLMDTGFKNTYLRSELRRRRLPLQGMKDHQIPPALVRIEQERLLAQLEEDAADGHDAVVQSPHL